MLTTVVIHTKTDTFKSISVAVTKLFLSKNVFQMIGFKCAHQAILPYLNYQVT